MHSDDSQPRQSDESSQVEHTNGVYMCDIYKPGASQPSQHAPGLFQIVFVWKVSVYMCFCVCVVCVLCVCVCVCVFMCVVFVLCVLCVSCVCY